jgi:long-chain acyl-CoA synthetase
VNSLWDKIIFRKTKEIFGGRLKWMLTGSAPINPEALNFLKIISCCQIYEAYGMTESCAASFLTKKIDTTNGHVGGPTGNTEFKLVDVAELDYRTTDKDSNG